MLVSCVLMRFVAIAISCKVCLTGAQRGIQSLTLDMWERLKWNKSMYQFSVQ